MIIVSTGCFHPACPQRAGKSFQTAIALCLLFGTSRPSQVHGFCRLSPLSRALFGGYLTLNSFPCIELSVFQETLIKNIICQSKMYGKKNNLEKEKTRGKRYPPVSGNYGKSQSTWCGSGLRSEGPWGSNR